MNLELHLIDGGIDRGPLPDLREATVSPVFCDYGSLSFTYPAAGRKFALLRGRDELEIVPFIDGVRQDKLGGLVREIDGDDIEEAAVFKFSGQGYLSLLDEALVYPPGYPQYDRTSPTWKFQDQSAGAIMLALVAAAKARGSLLDVEVVCTNNADALGHPWQKQITFEVKPGVTLTTVLKNMHSQNMCEFEMVGRKLYIYNVDSLTEDRTVQRKPLTFRKGRDLTDSPRKISSRNVATVVLAAGKEDRGYYREEASAQAIHSRGRRIERYVSNGNVTDEGTLDAWATAELVRSSAAQMEKTHGLAFASKKSPRPIRDFNVGDWAFSDVGQGLEKLRVKQWALSLGSDGTVTGSVVLNDLFAEFSERLSKRVEGIVGGTTITGESRAENRVPDDLVDEIAPKTPTSLSLSSAAYTDSLGIAYAQISATWAQVTANVDNTVIEDLEGYRLKWKYVDEPDSQMKYLTVPTPFASWSPVQSARPVEAYIQAFDRIGNASPWSLKQTITPASDATQPSIPAALEMSNYAGLLRLRYPGGNASGGPMETDVDRYEIHMGTTNNFTPTTATRIDTLKGAGSAFADVPYGERRYGRVVAVDRAGNRSDPSATSSAVTAQILSADIFDGAIGSAKLADLAVTEAKIALLAVNNAQIGSLDVGKLTAGVLNAQITLSGRIATALTGVRTEINSQGIFRFAADGTTTVAIDNAGALITGRYRTAVSGRRIDMGSANNTGSIRFYSPDGKEGYLTSFTATSGDIGVEALQIGMKPFPAANIWGTWNSLQFGHDEETYMSQAALYMTIGGNSTSAASKAFALRWAVDRGSDDPKRFYTSKNKIYIDEQSQWMYVRNDGTFFFSQREGTNSDDTSVRMSLSNDWNSWYGHENLNPRPRLEFRRSDGYIIHGSLWTGHWRQVQPWMDEDRYYGDGWGRMHLMRLGGGNSPGIKMYNDAGWGSLIKFYTAGGNDPQRFEVRWGGDDGFYAVWAQAFVVNSAAATKAEITDAPGKMLDVVKSAPVRQYRRQRPPDPKKVERAKGKAVALELGELEIGLLGHEAPALIRSGAPGEEYENVDLYQMATVMWGSIQELSAELELAKAEIAALKKPGPKK